jgi:hypothetical protein
MGIGIIIKGENPMTTQTDISKTNQTIHLPAEKKNPVGTVALVITLALALILITNSIIAAKTSALSSDNRALSAWTARYQGQADAYALKSAENSQRAMAAWIARYEGLAGAYALRIAATQRANAAWAARYQGMADHYALKSAANSQRVMDAWAARYQIQADAYALKDRC